MKKLGSLLISLLAVSGVAVGLSSHSVQAAAADFGTCQNITVQAALSAGAPANQTMHGTLCTPTGMSIGEGQLDVLVHGATYNRTYWDWPAADYSYAEKTLQAGRAVFFYDRLAAGQSSRPLSAQVSMKSEAYVMNQVINHLNQLGYDDVSVVGHSMGSVAVIQYLADFGHVDRAVITGLLHAEGIGLPGVMLSTYPAMFDPAFAGTLFDPGYLTTLPGTRANSFYNATADPALITHDEATKDIVSSVQLNDTLTSLLPLPTNPSHQVKVPLLVVAAEDDTLYCGLLLNCSNQAAIAANEAHFYTNVPSLSVELVHDTGHNLALHPTKNQSFQIIDNWINTH